MVSQALSRLLSQLPRAVASEILRTAESYSDFEGSLQEIRLRLSRPASLVLDRKNLMLSGRVGARELSETLRALCGGSVYACADSLREGYVTFEGYRVGVAGRAVSEQDTLIDVGAVDALCIRIPHAVRGAGGAIVGAFRSSACREGVLVYSPPGGGKTTALRDAAATLSGGIDALRTVIVDSRGELGAEWWSGAHLIDILSGYPKAEGIAIATRTLSPELIICDEIGGAAECEALLEVQNCGVPIIASVHARAPADLALRPSVSRLISRGAFGWFVGIKNPRDNIYEYESYRFSEVAELFGA